MQIKLYYYYNNNSDVDRIENRYKYWIVGVYYLVFVVIFYATRIDHIKTPENNKKIVLER